MIPPHAIHPSFERKLTSSDIQNSELNEFTFNTIPQSRENAEVVHVVLYRI